MIIQDFLITIMLKANVNIYIIGLAEALKCHELLAIYFIIFFVILGAVIIIMIFESIKADWEYEFQKGVAIAKRIREKRMS